VTRTQLWGRLIKKAREEAGLTQRQLAEMIGVEQPSIHRWELGQAISDDRKEAVAVALDKPVDELFPWVAVA
jgi:transcriptional regulator with XRE-family HTH domain